MSPLEVYLKISLVLMIFSFGGMAFSNKKMYLGRVFGVVIGSFTWPVVMVIGWFKYGYD
jgi:hypothetical protein